MMKKRLFKDKVLNGLTFFTSGISVLVLFAIFFFIFQKGYSTLSLDMLSNNYWSVNYNLAIPESSQSVYTYPSIESGESFSSKYGIAFKDDFSPDKKALIVVSYVDPASPFKLLTDLSAGPNQGQVIPIQLGMNIEKIVYTNTLGVDRSAGVIFKQNASELVNILDTQATKLLSTYTQTEGGGIKGSLIATLYLILISLAIAMPLGIFSAIYLTEYAAKNKTSAFIRSSIELLTGVPSIIYGLMGMVVLYPITTLFKVSGPSVLLGGLTLSIILLPTIIRTTEEALKVVPEHFRSASLSLGANYSQTIFKVVLPSAVPGILTGILLSVGRVIGESAALIYTMGTFVNDSPSVTRGGTSLAVQIWSIMSGEQPNFALASAISIIILGIVLFINISIKLLARRFAKTW